MSTPAIVTETHDAVTIVRFARPAERNPLSSATLSELQTILTNLNSGTRKLVFTGTEDVFASGADIREVGQLNQRSATDFSRLGQQLFQMIAEAKPVTIAAVNGYCMGGALDLILACDIRLASSNAVFAHPGPRLGIITGWGGTQRLPRLIGRTHALEILLTAKRLNAAEALRVGLVHELDDPVLSKALDVRISG